MAFKKKQKVKLDVELLGTQKSLLTRLNYIAEFESKIILLLGHVGSAKTTILGAFSNIYYDEFHTITLNTNSLDNIESLKEQIVDYFSNAKDVDSSLDINETLLKLLPDQTQRILFLVDDVDKAPVEVQKKLIDIIETITTKSEHQCVFIMTQNLSHFDKEKSVFTPFKRLVVNIEIEDLNQNERFMVFDKIMQSYNFDTSSLNENVIKKELQWHCENVLKIQQLCEDTLAHNGSNQKAKKNMLPKLPVETNLIKRISLIALGGFIFLFSVIFIISKQKDDDLQSVDVEELRRQRSLLQRQVNNDQNQEDQVNQLNQESNQSDSGTLEERHQAMVRQQAQTSQNQQEEKEEQEGQNLQPIQDKILANIPKSEADISKDRVNNVTNPIRPEASTSSQNNQISNTNTTANNIQSEPKNTTPKPAVQFNQPQESFTQPQKQPLSAYFRNNQSAFAIQIVSGANKNSVLNLARREFNNHPFPYAVIRTDRNGQDWYTLVFGAFRSRSDAKFYIENSLTQTQKQRQPFIKSIASISEIRLNDELLWRGTN